MDPSENPNSGVELFTGVHQGVKPFGPSHNPASHFQPCDEHQAARVMPGEQPDPRFQGSDPPAGPVYGS